MGVFAAVFGFLGFVRETVWEAILGAGVVNGCFVWFGR
jgi:hypothetical protein